MKKREKKNPNRKTQYWTVRKCALLVPILKLNHCCYFKPLFALSLSLSLVFTRWICAAFSFLGIVYLFVALLQCAYGTISDKMKKSTQLKVEVAIVYEIGYVAFSKRKKWTEKRKITGRKSDCEEHTRSIEREREKGR